MHILKHTNELLLGILLIFSLLIRIANFNIEAIYSNWDANRLYLIANHIIKYREFPSVGASTGYLLELKRSPVWYYFSAALLLIKNDILFLAWVNIFLSILTILIVYILTRVMFSKSTALIAATLFSFSQLSFQQAIFYIWEPFVTQTLLILSLLMFILSYQRNNYPLLLFGIFIYAFASSFYHSAFFIFPAIIFLIFYILIRQKRKPLHYFGAFTVLLASLLIFYFPVLIYHITNSQTISFLKPSKGLIAPMDFLPELSSLLYIFSDSYFLNLNKNILSLNNFLFLLLMGGLINIFLTLKQAAKKESYFLIILFILTPLVLIALFQINRPFHDPQSMPVYGLLRYFLASIVLFIILIAHVVSSTLSKYSFLYPIKILLIFALIYSSFPSLSNHLNGLSSNLPREWHKSVPNVPAVDAIKEEIYKLKDEEHLNDVNFFQISAYEQAESGSFIFDLPSFWVILEKDLKTRLVKLDDRSIYTYKPIENNKEIIFLVCYRFSGIADEEVNCIDSFKKGNLNYSITKHIYSQYPYSVYVTKQVKI